MKLAAALLAAGYLAQANARAVQMPLQLKPKAPEGMELHPLSVSGNRDERVNLAFFADGYTVDERDKFLADAARLTADIVAEGGAMAHVRDLLNVWGVFVPSKESGLGQEGARDGAPFGLYRHGSELRAVYAAHQGAARAACTYWRERATEGGCDQAILLGNDGLYGGLGGEFTIITASHLNGPLVLRHELGHSLIPVGEEYDGGYYYEGADAEIVENIGNLSWSKHLTDPANVRIEDLKVPLQAYPWHDLDAASYSVDFTPTATRKSLDGLVEAYDSALLRLSLSSIPYPNHVEVTIGGRVVDLSPSFPAGEWEGSRDRRWIEILLEDGLSGLLGEPISDHPTPLTFTARLTATGRKAETGQGGKMITSVEIIEYGDGGRCHTEPGFIGAFPTYAENGTVTLRPMNEECLMRRVTHPTFCPVCAEALRLSLEGKLVDRARSRLEMA